MEAVELITPEKSLSMKEACIERARIFALDDFATHMQDYFLNDEKAEELDAFLPIENKTIIQDDEKKPTQSSRENLEESINSLKKVA